MKENKQTKNDENLTEVYLKRIFYSSILYQKKWFKLYKNDILLCIASFWPLFVIFLNGNTQNGKWNFHWSPFMILQPLFCQIDKLENVAVKSLRE